MSIDPVAAHNMLDQSTFIYTASNPLAAAKAVARALLRQHRGGRLSFLRLLTEALAEGEPNSANFLADVRRDLDRAMAR